jgi:hypothetical protein
MNWCVTIGGSAIVSGVCVLLSLGGVAHAEGECVGADRAANAERLADEGDRANAERTDAGYARAVDLYRASQRCVPDSDVQALEAVALVRLKRLGEALPLLLAAKDNPAFAVILEQSYGKVVFGPDEHGLLVHVDGQARDVGAHGEVWVIPGAHEITLQKEGYERQVLASIQVAEGERRDIPVELKKTPTPAVAGEVAVRPAAAEAPPATIQHPTATQAFDGGSTQFDEGSRRPGFSPVPAYVAFGMAAVGGGVGTYFGLDARDTWNDATAACPQYRCNNPSDLVLEGRARESADAATAAFILAGTSLTTAVVLWLLSD